MERATIFIYGTLKRGARRAHVLAEQQFLGPARTGACYRLYDCGAYPALVEVAEGGVAVEGELWGVDATCLATLDAIEGVAEGLYRRGAVRLRPPFTGADAQTYLFLGRVAGLRDCGPRWDDPRG